MGRRRHHHDHDHDAPVAESPVIETPPVVVEPEPVVDIPPVPAILKFGVIVGQEQNYVNRLQYQKVCKPTEGMKGSAKKSTM